MEFLELSMEAQIRTAKFEGMTRDEYIAHLTIYAVIICLIQQPSKNKRLTTL
jgi:hypothetical protein